jgi:hypothetical protein
MDRGTGTSQQANREMHNITTSSISHNLPVNPPELLLTGQGTLLKEMIESPNVIKQDSQVSTLVQQI